MPRQAPTYDDFVAAYPAFVSSTIAETQLSLSTKLLDPSVWEDFYSEGVMLDCAHNLSLMEAATSAGITGGIQSAVGPISSVSAAGTSTSFNTIGQSATPGTADWYNKTSYGQMFLRLRAAVVPLGGLAG